ncbi:Uncharacterised protein [Enterobacter cloacae]|nr:Uncharacterised protein [Enterobacter cloacae]
MMQTTVTHKTTLLRTDGFVRNIHSRNPFDVIRADVVLARMEKRAGKTCGAYYESMMSLCWEWRWTTLLNYLLKTARYSWAQRRCAAYF